MPDIMTVLQNLPQTTAPTDEAVVAADVSRGHRAVSRRRQQRIGFTAAAIVAVAGVAVGAGRLGPTTDHQPSTIGVSVAGLQMVAYTGQQPAGFEVSTVPNGWTVISSNQDEFVVAPPGHETGGGPSDGPPSTGPVPVFYDGRIAVYMIGDGPGPKASHVEKVDINGQEGKLGAFHHSATSPDAHFLMFPSKKGTVMVQVPDSTGLSNDQIVTFARGITVTSSVR